MKAISKLFGMAVVVVLLTSFAAAQGGTLLRGRMPLKENLPPMADLTSNAAPVTFGGAIIVTFNITLKAPLTNTDTVTCTIEASTYDGASISNPLGNPIIETGTAIGTYTGATTAKCIATIHYSWALTTQATDAINLTYSVLATAPAGAAAPALQRTSTQGLGSLPVPASGTQTTKSIPVVL
jgi:hypothetical protein